MNSTSEPQSAARVRYIEGEVLHAGDLNAEQANRIAMRRRHNLAHYDWGVVTGLTVEGNFKHNTLIGFEIKPGVAVDGFGRELFLAESVLLSPDDLKKHLQYPASGIDVWLVYRRLPADSAGRVIHAYGGHPLPRWREQAVLRVIKAPAGDLPPDPPFGPQDVPPDDPAIEWPVFLGRIEGTKVTTHARRHATLYGEQVEHPSGDTRMRVGVSEDGTRKGFAVGLTVPKPKDDAKNGGAAPGGTPPQAGAAPPAGSKPPEFETIETLIIDGADPQGHGRTTISRGLAIGPPPERPEGVLVNPLGEGFDLRLMSSVSDVSSIPTSGKNLVIVADVKGVLHFRTFDADGRVVVDTDETSLTTQAGPIADLKRQLESLWPPHELTSSEKDRVIAAVTSIVGHALGESTLSAGSSDSSPPRPIPPRLALAGFGRGNNKTASSLVFRQLKAPPAGTIFWRVYRVLVPNENKALPALDQLRVEILNPGDKGDPARNSFTILATSDGFDLRLISWGDGSGVPTSGNNLVIVGADNNSLLHIRIFDAGGNRVTDTDETKLPSTQAGAISTLKQQLPGLLPPHVLTGAEKAQVIAAVTSIVGQTPTDHPCLSISADGTVTFGSPDGKFGDLLVQGQLLEGPIAPDPSDPRFLAQLKQSVLQGLVSGVNALSVDLVDISPDPNGPRPTSSPVTVSFKVKVRNGAPFALSTVAVRGNFTESKPTAGTAGITLVSFDEFDDFPPLAANGEATSKNTFTKTGLTADQTITVALAVLGIGPGGINLSGGMPSGTRTIRI